MLGKRVANDEAQLAPEYASLSFDAPWWHLQASSQMAMIQVLCLQHRYSKVQGLNICCAKQTHLWYLIRYEKSTPNRCCRKELRGTG